MAAHLRDDILYGYDHPGSHASDNRWRHQESGSFARHAAFPQQADENTHNGEADVQTLGKQNGGRPGRVIIGVSHGNMEVNCGPLLNYRRMEDDKWFGSVLIVTRGGGLGEGPVPELRMRIIDSDVDSGSRQDVLHNGDVNATGAEAYGVVSGVDYGNGQQHAPASQPTGQGPHVNGATGDGGASGELIVKGTKIYSDPAHTFWRFNLEVPMRKREVKCSYRIPGLSFTEGPKRDEQSFFVPAISESMRIMFHSCNGFSVGTDEDAWSGAALWNDVLRVHKRTPFHVMYDPWKMNHPGKN